MIIIMVVIVMGLPGSGKSYFAIRLTQMLNAKYISSDRIRKEMYITPAYSFESKALVYDEMLRRAIVAAKHGKEAVLDATFYSNDLRQKFINAVHELTDVFWIEIIADENLVKKRLMQSREDSDANFDVYQILKSKCEPFSDNRLVLKSTNDNVLNMLEQAADYLFSKDDTTKH